MKPILFIFVNMVEIEFCFCVSSITGKSAQRKRCLDNKLQGICCHYTTGAAEVDLFDLQNKF